MGALDGECSVSVRKAACGQKKGESADAVEVAIITLIPHPLQKGFRVSTGDGSPELFLPALGCLEKGGGDFKRVVEAGAEMAAVDADDDAQLFARWMLLQQGSQGAAEPVKILKVVPFGKTFDIGMESAAEERDESDRLCFLSVRSLKLMQSLQPEKREFDGVLAFVRGRGG